jgi:hypothetical protein
MRSADERTANAKRARHSLDAHQRVSLDAHLDLRKHHSCASRTRGSMLCACHSYWSVEEESWTILSRRIAPVHCDDTTVTTTSRSDTHRVDTHRTPYERHTRHRRRDPFRRAHQLDARVGPTTVHAAAASTESTRPPFPSSSHSPSSNGPTPIYHHRYTG